MRRTPGGYSYSSILLRDPILTRHRRGGRVEDASGDVTGHPIVKLQALILDGLVGWMVVGSRLALCFGHVFVLVFFSKARSVFLAASVGPMQALAWPWLVVLRGGLRAIFVLVGFP